MCNIEHVVETFAVGNKRLVGLKAWLFNVVLFTLQVLDPEDVAAAVIYAVTAPPHVGVHELMVEPKDQM
jgi:NADP-dependent 3-hydroxy acid dehydrogenase YdfG